MEKLTELQTLYVYCCSELEELQDVQHLKSLEELDVSGCVKLKRVRGLAQMTKLHSLNARDCF